MLTFFLERNEKFKVFHRYKMFILLTNRYFFMDDRKKYFT